MKKVLYLFLTAMIISNAFSASAFAQPTNEEVQRILQEKGLSMEELQEMLDYYEYPLEDFESAEELSDFIGTPITEENLNALLNQYGMTRPELDALLEGFGLSVQDHFAIEDLETSVEFAMNHDKEMKELEEFLTVIGITEVEADKLFKHFEALDQLQLEEKMEQIGSRLESLMTYDPDAELTDQQINEVISVWNDMMGILDLRPEFSLVDAKGNKTPISFNQLTEMEEFNSDGLYVALYTTGGELLLDMQVSKDMLSSDFAISAGEKLTDIGDLAGELTKLKHSLLPDTASPYGLNILLGFFILAVGMALLIIRNKQMKQG